MSVAIMEHIEMAGIHSGDSACCTPPFALSDAIQCRSCAPSRAAWRCAWAWWACINIQFAIKDQVIYMIEANPRASRTVPFAVEGHGRAAWPRQRPASWRGRASPIWACHADDRRLDHYSVKEAVMPFGRFPGADTVLGPEMKSTGEVMGIAGNFPGAFAKTQLAISYALPEGAARCSSACATATSAPSCPIARDIVRLGFHIVATERHSARAAGGRRGLRQR